MANLPTIAAPAQTSGVSSILQNTQAFLDLVNGKTSTVSSGPSTTTSSSDISTTGIQNLVQQMLNGTGGLADLASGAHTAGLYGDTTKTLLTNDLLTKIAGTAAQASATKTTTTSGSSATTTQKSPLNAQSIGASLLTAGIASLGAKAAKKSGVLDAFGLGDSGTTGGPVATGVDSLAGLTGSGEQADEGFLGGFTPTLDTSGFSAAADNATSGATFDASDFGDTSSVAAPDFDSDVGTDLFSGSAGDAGSDASSFISGGDDDPLSFLGFARGGKVSMGGSRIGGYASGGIVNPNRGTDTTVRATPVNDPVGRVATSGGVRTLPGGDSGSGTNSSDAPIGPNAGSLSIADAVRGGALALGFVSNPVMGLANIGSTIVSGKGITSNILGLLGSALGIGGDNGPPGAGVAPGSAGLGTESAPAGNSGAGLDSFGIDTSSSPVADAASVSANAGSGSGSDSGSGDAPGAGVGEGGDDGGGSAGAGSSGGGTGDGGGGDGSGDFASGGQITAPGDGSTDTRVIKAADDEFVLNANAAKAIGYDKLNWLNTVLGGMQR